LQEIEGAKGVSRNEIGIHIAGTNAWVAHAVGGVFGVDLRLPNLPEVVAAFDTPGRARRVVVAGDRVYVADGDGGLLVLGWEGWAPRSQVWLPWVSAGGSASAAAQDEVRDWVLDTE
jgi:hypothetical protein